MAVNQVSAMYINGF